MTDLRSRLQDCDARIGMIGLGYVGLPLSLEFTRAGYSVAGFDIDADRVASLQGGVSYVDDVNDEELTAALDSGFTPDDDPAVVEDCDAYVIAVPTGISNGEPKMDAIRTATRTVAEQAGNRDTLVVVSSTVYPGATREEVVPLLHERRDPDQTHVAMVPERLNPGGDYPIGKIPVVVGADKEPARTMARTLFESVVAETHPVDATSTAELTKTLENTYRMVNIALVNELTAFAETFEADIWDAIDAASTKPFGFQAFYPGPGVGGHCIPIDPQFLTWRASEFGTELPLVENAQRTNEWMPLMIANRINRLLTDRDIDPDKAAIVTLGAAYKPDVSDLRHSPALEVTQRLNEKSEVVAVDPHVDLAASDVAITESINDAPIEQADIVVLLVDHSEFDLKRLVERASLVFDTRNVVPTDGRAEVLTLGDESGEPERPGLAFSDRQVDSKPGQ